jgi:hypothetical protein
MTRRPLGEMLAEVGLGTLPALAQTAGLHVWRVAVELPVEIGLHGSGADAELLGDMPRLRTRTAFDIQPSRMVIVRESRS